ncbi:MAG: hypothetical protein VB858_08865, partial [Planctomycetaceae bacterium]
MATQTPTRSRRGAKKKQKSYAECDEYIQYQLQSTRTGIRSTDLFTAACGVALGGTTYLLAFVLLDHWVVPGGFGYLWRVGLLSVMLISSLGWIGWKIVMPWLKSINRLYAARTIEQASPDLNSTLLNYVDLQQSRRDVAPQILRSLEKQAAVSLSQIPVDEVIDRRPVLRLSYALLFVVAVFCLYTVFSPKKVGPSIWRALMPASTVQVATQTQFLSITPGDTTAFSREIIEVTVDLTGEIPTDVILKFTTDDRSFENEPVLMRQINDGIKQYRCLLNGENGEGLLQSISYWIEAGDATSEIFHISVAQPPSVTIHSVRYEFPPYTQLAPQTVKGGAIKTLEGARIRIEGEASMPIKIAKLQFSDSELFEGKPEEAPMQIAADGIRLSCEFQPQLRDHDQFPAFYRIWCKTDAGDVDPSPVVHPIVVNADQVPGVSLVYPTADRTVAANAIVPMLIRSSDPDFRLSQVRLILKRDTESLPFQLIYQGDDQAVEKLFELKIEDLHVRPGDTVTYWAEAHDNRFVEFSHNGIQLGANRSRTTEQQFHIAEPVSEEEAKREAEAEQQQIKNLESADSDNGDSPENNDTTQPEDNAGENAVPEPATTDTGAEKSETDQPGENNSKPQAKPENEDQTADNSQAGTAGEKPKSGETGTGSETQTAENSQSATDGQETRSTDNTANPEGSPGKGPPPADRTLSNDGRDDAEALSQILKAEQENQQQNNPDKTPASDDNPGQSGAEDDRGPESNPADNASTSPEGTGTSGSNPDQPDGQTPPGTKPNPDTPGTKPEDTGNGSQPDNPQGDSPQ